MTGNPVTPELAAQQRAMRWVYRLLVAAVVALAGAAVLAWRQGKVEADEIVRIFGGALSFVTVADVFWFSRRRSR